MGYECPVCATPQADRRHLADHLAMTALTRGGDHETWLDEHAPEWNQMGPEDLGEAIEEYATERDYPQLFEDTVADHDHGDSFEEEIARAGRGRGDLTEDQRSVLREAREMTEEMLDGDEEEDA